MILHMGAHRTGTTTFQKYLRNNQDNLTKMGMAYWGPRRTRSGLLAGLFTRPDQITPAVAHRAKRSGGRVRLATQLLARKGTQTLIVSDENMLGTMQGNVSRAMLYPDGEARLRRFYAPFGESCTRVCISIRSYENYWASVLAFMIAKGYDAPDRAMLERLAIQPYRWRDVIAAASVVFQNARIIVWPFESFASQPEQQLAMLTGAPVPIETRGKRDWVNASMGRAQLRALIEERGESGFGMHGGDGRWQPFAPDHVARLRRDYLEDLAWLRAGADGLATYIESAGTHPRTMTEEEGHADEQEERRLGHPR